MHRALNQLSFEALEGEFVAVMGPSGSGKTTLLNLISSIDLPTYGRIFINNIEPEKLTENNLALFRRSNLGFVFQEINLLN
ncbi:ATP-binding cassette domain-containing protein, partial [Microvirga sp. 3-52]|nr:ATP-binding cassette domain-containing protein [Microvirga sp. 3-52]